MTFSDLILHPAIAATLAARGYETATAVQAAVLDARCAGRDLLVSSQTGSGKTVAFGAALVHSLLGDGTKVGPAVAGSDDIPPTGAATLGSVRGAASGNPLALVVVPTRELAVQVRDELAWLLKQTGLKMASFTGGTAVSGDLRALQKGVDLVIGTPGRLCDLLRRQRLELANIRVVILDEADEMLDLGFREDLQTLLQAAPETRRTLMLSATLPPEIRALARRFQRDALPIDPRKDAGATAPGAHDDITYVAHLISGSDRLAVVVNVLRSAGTGRAIVFCTTREGVSRLHAALLARGFAATAISGDRAQAERDRALDLLRRGDARVLVATNVAARGLHLPDVDLIVHADLPLNADSLTHRSGRTGRAGRKGTAVVIAAVSERRKAERLLMSAHVPVVWTPPPSAETITAAARNRLAEDLLRDDASDSTDEGAWQITPAVEELALRLEEKLSSPRLLRRLLIREIGRLPVGERVHAVSLPAPGLTRPGRFDDHDEPSGRPRGRGEFNRDGVLFRVNIGAKEKADPRWLLPLICRRGGVTRREVGAIRVGPTDTVFEIAGDAASDFALAASETDPRAPHVMIARSQSQIGSSSPSARPQPIHGSRPHTATPQTARPQAPPVEAKRGPAPLSRTTGPHISSAQAARAPVPPAQAKRRDSPRDPGASRVQPPHAHAPSAPAPSYPVAAQGPVQTAGASAMSAQLTPVVRAKVISSEKRQPSIALPPKGLDAPYRGDRLGRAKTPIPVIEMKHAHRQSGIHRDKKNQDPPRARQQPERPPVKFNNTSGRETKTARALDKPDRPPPGESRPARKDDHARTAQTNRARTDGTNPAKRTPPPSAFSSSASARAPFWKDGARRRPDGSTDGFPSAKKNHKGR